MSYCRFQNTLNDLRDCYDNMDSDNLSKEEFEARKQLIDLCTAVYENYSFWLSEEFEEEVE